MGHPLQRIINIEESIKDLCINIVSYKNLPENLNISSWSALLQKINDTADGVTPIKVYFPKGDYNFNTTVTINKPNIYLFGEGKIISGDFEAIKINKTDTPYVTAISFDGNNKITVSDTASLTVGTRVKLQGITVSMHSEIVDITGNIVTIADTIDFIIDGITNLYLTTDMNCIIDGLVFEKNTSTSRDDLNVSGHITGVTIKNCRFISSKGLTFAGIGYSIVKNCKFSNTKDSCFMYDVCFIDIIGNELNYYEQGIRCAHIYGMLIKSNKLKNGKSKQYSTGIEISGVNMTNKKSSNCKIINNTVVNSNIGVAGSALGGIHLNFYSHNCIIEGNISNDNGMGIYLENYNYNIIIKNNICSYNRGWYGVGIELDWNSEDILIEGNICDYNSGDLLAVESCGIFVRGGYDQPEHIVKNIVVQGNKCRYNGRDGITIWGEHVTCKDNILHNNGTNTGFSVTSDLSSAYSKNCIISSNQITSTAKYSMYIDKPIRMNISNNNIEGNYNNTSCVYVKGIITNLKFEKNVIVSASTQRCVHFNGDTGSTYVNVIGNEITQGNNGFPVLELDNIDKYRELRNDLLDYTNKVIYQCTNPLT